MSDLHITMSVDGSAAVTCDRCDEVVSRSWVGWSFAELSAVADKHRCGVRTGKPVTADQISEAPVGTVVHVEHDDDSADIITKIADDEWAILILKPGRRPPLNLSIDAKHAGDLVGSSTRSTCVLVGAVLPLRQRDPGRPAGRRARVGRVQWTAL